MNKEETAEHYCFVCKDVGDLITCDYKDCLKSYHPDCVEEENSFLEKEKRLNCGRHSCHSCQKPARFQCFCCPKAFCKQCIDDADFVPVRGDNGFCSTCLKLALLVEEGKDVHSYWEMVDFKGRKSIEVLFMEYYETIKKKEGWTTENLHFANRSLKEGKIVKVNSSLDDEDEFHYEDDNYSEEDKPVDRRKRFKRQKVVAEWGKPKRMEYIGWGSKPLIEFLTLIGKDTTHALSQHDAYIIISDYIHKNKLADPVKKKTVFFDERLNSLFGKRKANKYKIFDLLGEHISGNIETSEDETGDCSHDKNSSNDEDKNAFVPSTRHRKASSDIKPPKEKVNCNVVESCFASMIASNIKLIYLRRSLVVDIIKQPETFEEKVVGCFVRVRSDPSDYSQKNSHQLLQVKGIKKSLRTGEIDSEIILQVPYMPTDIPIPMLSDDDFSEEECEYLQQQVKEGLVTKLTVGQLQQKALSLHEVITKHWIVRELAVLQKRIDQANEKGWRAELFKYLEKRRLLESPAEQSRLLQEFPEVIADVAESEQTLGDNSDKWRSSKW